jgi:hypothetical protein
MIGTEWIFQGLTQRQGKENREAATADADHVMDIHEQARAEMIGHLLDAIEQVRKDMAKVDLWAAALNGFSRPIPDYELDEGRVWVPPEQANNLKQANARRRKL